MSISIVHKQSDTLVIATTGFRHELSLTIGEFFKQAGLSDASTIIITDRTRRVCLAGFPPDYPTFFDFIDFLRAEIEKIPHRRLIITGTSMGGHTALLLGHLLRANQVVVFAPYTYLSMEAINAMNDVPLKTAYSKRNVCQNIEHLPSEARRLLDLHGVLSDWNGRTQYYIHVSRYNRWDFWRAKYLAPLQGVSVVAHPCTTHGIPSFLARFGKLKRCFTFPYKQEVTAMDMYFHVRYTLKYFATRLPIFLRG